MKRMLATHHATLLGLTAHGLVQTRNLTEALEFDTLAELGALLRTCLDDALVIDAGLDCVLVVSGGHYLCAEPDGRLVADRTDGQAWECFRVIDSELGAIMLGNGRQRLAAAVEALNQTGRPVRLHFACGHNPIPGFLNIDRSCWAKEFAAAHPEAYFLLPTVGIALPLPDASVDFAFHEDFIEHIGQLDQISFLAEVRRVLRPGGVHRVNTPNLIWTMQTRSRFELGFDGVYMGERQWEHLALFSPASLKEVAQLVGYSQVHFNGRGQSISPLAIPDRRPYGDRDECFGNIFADLVC